MDYRPSQANQKVFNLAIGETVAVSKRLPDSFMIPRGTAVKETMQTFSCEMRRTIFLYNFPVLYSVVPCTTRRLLADCLPLLSPHV
jgi:hypothetical protein